MTSNGAELSIPQRDLSALPANRQEEDLQAFERRLRQWCSVSDPQLPPGGPSVSVETPAFKGAWLAPCIESVLRQTSPAWIFSAHWDGGDDLSRRILQIVERVGHPRLQVSFGPNQGIARTRRLLSEGARGDYILPLDDDDMLVPHAIERFLACVREKPWSGLVRARREFINEVGARVDADPWFPFEPRRYQHGMVTDLFNHSQPTLIARRCYERTSGWEGFDDFRSAGEDCDMVLKIEELGPIVLLDEVLYQYRLSHRRTSLILTNEAAFEMWRRLADKTIARIELPLRRVSDMPPYKYERVPRPPLSKDAIAFVITRPAAPWGGTSGLEALTALTRDSLARCGVAGAAIQVASDDPVGSEALNQRMLAIKAPVIGLLAAGVVLEDPTTLDVLMAEMEGRQADLAGPSISAVGDPVVPTTLRFDPAGVPTSERAHVTAPRSGASRRSAWLPTTALWFRREVARAVGGFDGSYGDDLLAAADFCLKARQRDFECRCVDSLTAIDHVKRGAVQGDIGRFTRKWRDWPRLLQPLAEESGVANG